MQIKNYLGLLWKSHAYVLSRKWSALSIGGNGSIPRPTNHFLWKEKEKMFVFSKMILRSTQKFLRILPLFEASVVFFSTQKFFRNINLIAIAFKTCLGCHIFLTRYLGGLQVPPIFLLKLKHTKNVILKSRVSVDLDLKFWIYWILLNFLTSTAPKKFFIRRNIT